MQRAKTGGATNIKEVSILTAGMMGICVGGGSQAHEDGKRYGCIHSPGREGATN